MRLEYYTPLKKVLFCSLKMHTLKKFAAALRVANLLSIFLQRFTRHSMASTNLLPTPMNTHTCSCLSRYLKNMTVNWITPRHESWYLHDNRLNTDDSITWHHMTITWHHMTSHDTTWLSHDTTWLSHDCHMTITWSPTRPHMTITWLSHDYHTFHEHSQCIF